MTVRNEEETVADVVSYIRDQIIPPIRIHVLNDGSTDPMSGIPDGMANVILTHNPPHPPDHSSIRYTTERHKLIRKAAEGVDYILHINANVYIPPDYMEQITERRGQDSVTVACSLDPEIPKYHVVEPGMVIDVKWLNTHATLLPYPLSTIFETHNDDNPLAQGDPTAYTANS